MKLQPLPISKLGRRSAKAGASMKEVDRAMDAADVKATLIDLSISKHAWGIDSIVSKHCAPMLAVDPNAQHAPA